MSASRCLDANTIAELSSGTLHEAQRRAALEHLDECTACRRLASFAAMSGGLEGEGAVVPRRGQKFAGYLIQETLGAGAMGVVYAGLDEDLRRKVALKLVRSSDFGGSDAGAYGRLLREAKTAAALSHPNVIVVHEVGEFEGQPFIAMELVEDGTLRDWLGASPRKPSEILAMYRAAGEGLAAAHRAGIVHRDFKPDNVLVGKDGRPRVADFGLAFPVEGLEEIITGAGGKWSETWATAGSVISYSMGQRALVGTPRYMSPEQMTGAGADVFSDQFAFCVSLWEALYGEPPFEGGDLQDLLSNISQGRLRQTPRRDVPGWVRSIVARGLAPVPGDRHPSMASLLQALDRDPAQARRRFLGGLALLAAIGTMAWATLPHRQPVSADAGGLVPTAPRFHPSNARRLTFSDGCDEYPSFLPDGRRVVFDATREGRSAIVILSLDGGGQRTITRPTKWDYAATASPDGREVAFLRTDEGGTVGTWRVDVEGHTEPRFVAGGPVRPSFSPDGTALWAGEIGHPTRYDLATGRVTRQVDSPLNTPAALGHELRDGRYVAVFPNVGVVAFDKGGAEHWLARDKANEVLAVAPGESYAISSRQTEANNVELFAVPLADVGPPRALPTGDVTPIYGLDLSPDGKAVVWSACHTVNTIVRVDESGSLHPIHGAVDWKESGVAAIPGGRRLAVVSMRAGPESVWVIDRDTGDAHELDARGQVSNELSASPDGTLVALQAGAGIVLAPVDGSARRVLTHDPVDMTPTFRADGRAVFFTRTERGQPPRVFAIDVAGGEVHPLLGPATRGPVAWPSDHRLAYLAGADPARLMPMIIDLETGEQRRLSPKLGEGRYRSLAISPDGRHVALLVGNNGVARVDVSTGEVAKVGDPRAGRLASLTYAGADLLTSNAQFLGNLWIADTSR